MIAVLALPASVPAEAETEYFWVCSQVGMTGKTHSYAVSNIFKAPPNDYEDKEILFEELASEQYPEFEPNYEARCKDFTNLERAEKYKQRKVERAEKKQFRILRVKFTI